MILWSCESDAIVCTTLSGIWLIYKTIIIHMVVSFIGRMKAFK